MRPRYIDATALMEFCSNMKDGCIDNNDIARFPTADVRENRHGNWIKMPKAPDSEGNIWYQCSECLAADLQSPAKVVPFCWACGASMDLNHVKEDLGR